MPGTTGQTVRCPHELLFITKRRFQISEYLIRRGEAELYLEHTHPVHEIHVRCQQCTLEKTYAPNQVPKWVEEHLHTIAELERRGRLKELLAELTEPIDLALLDELLDAGVESGDVVGKLADWHGENFPIVQLQSGKIVIRVELTCARCGIEKTTVYVGSGLHTGAFCYVFSDDGEYQADLRNQEYVCEDCQKKRETHG